MAEPYNYGAMLANPAESFTQGLKLGTLMDQQAQQAQQAQAQQQRAQQVAQAMASLQTDRSPENLSRILLNFPELKDQITASQQVLDDAGKTANRNFYGQVMMLRNAGMSDRALQIAEERVNALKNTAGKEQEAQVASAMLEAFRKNPGDFDAAMALYLQATDPEFYKTIAASTDKTALQKDFEFIKSTFGPQAAAEFAQYGRGGVVSIPLGNGQTYVGPAALAPGAASWQAQGGQGAAPAQAPQAQGPEQILGNASRSKRITQAEANVVKQSLGPNGQSAFDKWLSENAIKIITRTGTAPDGRRVVQFSDGTVEYAD